MGQKKLFKFNMISQAVKSLHFVNFVSSVFPQNVVMWCMYLYALLKY